MPARAEDLIAGFRQSGLKVTPQRQLLCTLVAESDDHPTVEAVHHRAVRRMPTISLKTVYTTLAELAELGYISLRPLGTGSVRVDPDPAPHAHLICRTCGEVVDQPYPFDEAPAGALALGFEVEEQEVIFRGRCARCREQAGESAKAGAVE